MSETKTWHSIELPEGAELVKQEWFEYSSEKGQFQIELFETISGTFYAIGIPKGEDEKLVIYGSSVVHDKAMALQIVIEKITREELL